MYKERQYTIYANDQVVAKGVTMYYASIFLKAMQDTWYNESSLSFALVEEVQEPIQPDTEEVVND